jgi:excisionase family DNA binding protein
MAKELTLPEAARRLQLTYFATYSLILTGKVRARQDGARRYRVRADDVEQLRRELRKKKNAQPATAERSANLAGDGGRRRATAT